MEKKIQREREMEKGEFDDKEAFVTSAYKKKLQERAEEEEREKRAAALEGEMGEGRRKQKRQNSALWLAVCSVTELLDYNVMVKIYVYEFKVYNIILQEILTKNNSCILINYYILFCCLKLWSLQVIALENDSKCENIYYKE